MDITPNLANCRTLNRERSLGYRDDGTVPVDGYDRIVPGKHMVCVGLFPAEAPTPEWVWIVISHREGRVLSGFEHHGNRHVVLDWDNVREVRDVPQPRFDLGVAIGVALLAVVVLAMMKLGGLYF